MGLEDADDLCDDLDQALKVRLMAEHHIKLTWDKGDAAFTYNEYPRNHAIAFKNGQETMIASAAPAYKGDASKADPEDLLVASLSSCHMLSFLAIASKKKVTVTSYEDDAVGFLENDKGDALDHARDPPAQGNM